MKIKHVKHSYAELSKVGKKYYNDTNFCTVIALAVNCDLSFGKSRALCKKIVGRRQRRGLNVYQIMKLYKDMGMDLVKVDRAKFGKTLATVSKNIPTTGRYLWISTSHASACRDGILEDWSADGKRRSRIQFCFEVKPLMEQ